MSDHTNTSHLEVKVAISKAQALFTHDGKTFNGDGHEGSRLVIPAGAPWTLAAACWKPDVFMVVVEIEGKDTGVVLRNASMDKLRAASSKKAATAAKKLAKAAAQKAEEDAAAAAADAEDAGSADEPEVAEDAGDDAGEEEGPSDGDLEEIEAAA